LDGIQRNKEAVLITKGALALVLVVVFVKSALARGMHEMNISRAILMAISLVFR
jgi:hypothetical protein